MTVLEDQDLTFSYTHHFEPVSEAIDSVWYDSERQKMVVDFIHGGSRLYHDVPWSVFDGFQSADSAGRYYHKNIKSNGFNGEENPFVYYDPRESVVDDNPEPISLRSLLGPQDQQVNVETLTGATEFSPAVPNVDVTFGDTKATLTRLYNVEVDINGGYSEVSVEASSDSEAVSLLLANPKEYLTFQVIGVSTDWS